jgi:hypothetical protein
MGRSAFKRWDKTSIEIDRNRRSKIERKRERKERNS